MFSATVISGTVASSWWIIEIPSASPPAVSWMLTSRPSKVTVPESLRYIPMRTFMRVDLPAPFSPTRACTVPGRTPRLTLSRATTPGKVLVMFSIRRMYSPDMTPHVLGRGYGDRQPAAPHGSGTNIAPLKGAQASAGYFIGCCCGSTTRGVGPMPGRTGGTGGRGPAGALPPVCVLLEVRHVVRRHQYVGDVNVVLDGLPVDQLDSRVHAAATLARSVLEHGHL